MKRRGSGRRMKVLVLVLLGFMLGKAQFVTIPDPNFVTYLQTLVPAAMSGNQLDTTHSSVTVTTQTINVYNKSVSDIYGVQFFKNLSMLDCQNNTISVMPPLPGTLKILRCAANSLTSLPALPNQLTELNCNLNSLTSLPAVPYNLSKLSCNFNLLTSLPGLPHGLTYLDFSNNSVTNITALPSSLTYLNCSNNTTLTALPLLPSNLLVLACSFNTFSSLPALPSTLTDLVCEGCPNLTTLPTLPSSLINLFAPANYFTSLPPFANSIKYINLYQTFNLTTFPAWPTSLQFLDCANSPNVTTLPAFPSQLWHLNCSSNPHLKVLPTLPATIQYLNTAYDSIYCFPPFPASTSTCTILPNDVLTCLPNHLPCMDAATLAYPICGSGNPNGCAVGMDEPKEVATLKVFPNPASDFIFITGFNHIGSEPLAATIFDLTGQVVMKADLAAPVNVSDLASGCYFISVQLKSGKTLRARFIKE